MPLELRRDDITHIQVDAIVNTTNPDPLVGAGVDSAIHAAAGPSLLEERQRLGRIELGEAKLTPGGQLPARYVIHTVAPVWLGGNQGEVRQLRRCYENCLRLAVRQGCESIAFPLLSAGNLGLPGDVALQTAMSVIGEFLRKQELQVYLVVFNRDIFHLSEKLFHSITSFIDEHYVEALERSYSVQEQRMLRDLESTHRQNIPHAIPIFQEDCAQAPDILPELSAPRPVTKEAAAAPARKSRFSLGRTRPTLAQMLEETDAGFSETLLKLIDRTGKKDSEVYTRANVSRQHFSKIRNNPDYKPTKPTAIAFAIALELDLEQTRDLIGRAGYALTNSSKFDVIIMYFIREKNYNLFDINAALFEFDQTLLGA